MREMSMQDWARGEQPTTFDFDCFTVTVCYSPFEQRFLGYVLVYTVAPYMSRGFRTLADLGEWLGCEPERTRGYCITPSEYEKRAAGLETVGVDWTAPEWAEPTDRRVDIGG